jgi:hypothetical protein
MRLVIDDIKIDDDFAIVRLRVFFSTPDAEMPPIIQPDMEGDLSYFLYDGRRWTVYGNQNTF